MQAPQGESKAIMLHPQPIQLAVETSTDWPAITATIFSGFAGALVAFAVGWMAYIGQRNQVRAAKANFRHDWQQEIKQLIGKFISTSARINYELEGNPDYLSNSESNQIFSELMETHARIELMLDRKKPYYNDISRITGDIVNAVRAKRINDLSTLANELINVANEVIEKTWQDIRDDLEGKH